MKLGNYCQEGSVDCLIMMISSILVIIDSFRLIWQIVQTSRHSVLRSASGISIKQIRGTYRKLTFRFKIAGVFTLMGISIAQSLLWVLVNRSTQSIIFLQMFAVNIFSCLLWIFAICQDKKHQGHTKTWTQVNLHVNLLCNIFIALLGARNSLDNNDDTAFYTYLGYIGTSGLLQIYIKTFQKDYDSIPFDELGSKNSSVFSIENQKQVDSNISKQESTKIEQNTLNERLLSDDDKPERKQNSIGNGNGVDNDAANAKRTKSKEEQSKKSKKRVPDNLEIRKNSNSGESSEKQSSLVVGAANSTSQNESTAEEEEETKICKYRIENIRIERFLETIKYQKKTIVYEVKCTYKGKMHSSKKSFREFGALNTLIKQKYKDKKAPQFPQKKAQNSILTFSDLEERKKQLCIYLQNINSICESEECLIQFLTQSDSQSASPTSTGSYIQQQQMKNGGKKSFGDDNNNSFNSGSALTLNIPDIIWEEDEELNVSASSHE